MRLPDREAGGSPRRRLLERAGCPYGEKARQAHLPDHRGHELTPDSDRPRHRRGGVHGLDSRIGPVAADALRREHFQILRAAADATGGHEVKTMGDGLMIVFQGAASAVNCAVRMQQQLERRNRCQEPLHVRIGIALGDAVPEDGDWFGTAGGGSGAAVRRSHGRSDPHDRTGPADGGRDGHAFRSRRRRWNSRVSPRLCAGTRSAGRRRADGPRRCRCQPASAQRAGPLRRRASNPTLARSAMGGHADWRPARRLRRGRTRDRQDALRQPGRERPARQGAVVLFGHCAEDLDAPTSR